MASEIRRDTPEARPINFASTPVVDNSTASMLEGAAKAVMGIDSALAQRRFNKAQEMLHAQYVVGSPAAETLEEDSYSDRAPLSPEDDRSLRDFKSILDTNSAARDQGRMNFESYQLRSERLLRVAIAKRPGLATEFRSIASSYVGTDVTGAESRYLAEQEQKMAQDAASAAKAKDSAKWKVYEDRVELMKANGLAGYALFDGPDDPGFQQYWSSTAPVLLERVRAEQQLQMAENTVKIRDLQNSYQAPENASVWIAQQEVLRSQAASLPDSVRTTLKMQGLQNDPGAIRQALEQATAGIRQSLAQSEADAVKYNIPADVRALYRERGEKLLAQFEAVITGTNDKELVETYESLLLGTERVSLLSNEEYRRTSAFYAGMPESVQTLISGKLEKQMVLLAADVLQENALPELVAKQAPAMLPQMVKAIYGGKGKDDPIATSRFAQVAQRALAAYITQPDEQWRAAEFLRNPLNGAPGTLQVLHDHATVIVPSLTPQQQQEMSTTMAAAIGHGWTVMGKGLFQKYPSLRGKVDFRFSPDGDVFRAREGAQLTEVERAGLKQYNTAANSRLAFDTLARYAGGTHADAAQLIDDAYSAGQELRASEAARAARQPGSTQGSSPSGQGAQRGSGGLSVGTVTDGYRYKGGDPNSPSSWEPVE